MWLFQHFLKLSFKAALRHLLCATESGNPQKEKTLSTRFLVVSYLLCSYAVDNRLAEAEREFVNFKQPEHMPVAK